MSVIDPIPRIETRRLALRAPCMSDATRLALLANDFDIARMTTRMPYPYRQEDAEAFLGRMETLDHAREAAFVIEHEDEGAIGVIALHPSDSFAPEIGYWLGRAYWGRGFATEAAAAVLAWTKSRWGRRALVSGHFADNPASGRVLEKAGFLYTGEVLPRHSEARGEPARTRMMVWLA
ncbi:MAG: GNAT family N-acetyltransferase [Caulobacteraceae bacterium]|nr:GNAT family N-acetyltransferase [Caulobacteraceae bacterium]